MLNFAHKSFFGLLAAALFTINIAAVAAIPPLPEAYLAKDSKAKLTMLEFSAPWCVNCQLLKPSIKKMIGETGSSLRVLELNIDEVKNQKMIKRYQVIATPTVLLFDSAGKGLQSFDNDVNPAELKEAVRKQLDKNNN